jgi:hypothetical protein
MSPGTAPVPGTLLSDPAPVPVLVLVPASALGSDFGVDFIFAPEPETQPDLNVPEPVPVGADETADFISDCYLFACEEFLNAVRNNTAAARIYLFNF